MKQSKNAKVDNSTQHTTLFNFYDPPFLVLCAVCCWPAALLVGAEKMDNYGAAFSSGLRCFWSKEDASPQTPQPMIVENKRN